MQYVAVSVKSVLIFSSMVEKPKLLHDQVKKSSQHNIAWLLVGFPFFCFKGPPLGVLVFPPPPPPL